MTAQEFINRALRLIGKLAQGQSPTAGETTDALSAMNGMLTRWEANGLTMGFSPVSAAGSTVPVPAEINDAVAYNLAIRLAPEYGYPIPAEVAAIAESTLRDLQRDATSVPRLDTGTPRTRGVFDFNSGQVI